MSEASGPSVPGTTGTPALDRQAPGRGLAAHQRDRFGGRADEDERRIAARRSERGVLGQKPVAGMHGVGAGRLRRVDQIDRCADSSRTPAPARSSTPRRPFARDAPRDRRPNTRPPMPARGRGRRGRCAPRSRRGWRSESCARLENSSTYKRNVPVLLGGISIALGFERRQRRDQLPARLARHDDLIDEAALGGNERIGKLLPIFVDPRRAHRRRDRQPLRSRACRGC